MKSPTTFPLCFSLSFSLLSASGVSGAAEAAIPFPLPDTGQTNRYTQTFGEDSDFTASGPSYTDNGDGTVTDQVTGLMWQKTDGGEMTWEKAREYARNLELGGHRDWRLPATLELFSIMNHDANRPAMDSRFFTRTDAEYWWADSSRPDGGSRVWAVNGGGGTGAHPKTATFSAGGDRPFHVRCVRGSSVCGAGPQLKDNGDGTVTDHRTGLVWQKIGPGQGLTWEEALRYCGSLKLAGHDDWRLPNIKELRSVSDDRKVRPSLDKTLFPEAQVAYYWSSTSQCNRPERAWFVDFESGLVSYADKPEQHLVLAVRGGVVAPGPKVKPAPDLSRFARPGGRPGEGGGPGGGKGKGDRKKGGPAGGERRDR